MRLKKHKKNIKFKTFFLFLVVLIITALFMYLKMFKVKSLDVQSEKTDCADNLQIKNSANILGQNLFLIDQSEVESDLKKKFICIDKINLSKIFPDRINLNAWGRLPKAILYVASSSAEASSEAYLADGEGVVFSKKVQKVIAPKIFFKDLDLYIGGRIAKFKDILEILNQSEKLGLDTTLSQILNSNLIILSHPQVVFNPYERADVQIASLQLILTKAKMDSSELDFIDLRFDKPVIKIAPEKSYGQR